MLISTVCFASKTRNPINMKVICAGLPKTGTKTLARALEILGYKNLDSIQQLQDFVDEWQELIYHGKTPDFELMFKDFDSVTDVPASFFFQEILEVFPDAKVVLLTREEEPWAASLSAMLMYIEDMERSCVNYVLHYLSPTYRDYVSNAKGAVNALLGSNHSGASQIHHHHRFMHINRVRKTVPEHQLLEYSVTDGWGPLCGFLGCEIPSEAFPHENKSGSFVKSDQVKISGRNKTQMRMIKEILLRLIGLVSIGVALVAYMWTRWG